MSRAMSLWLRLARRRAGRRPPKLSLWDRRRELVRRLSPGASLLDVGGMFHIHGDVAFWAEEAGARRVALCDGMDPSEEFQIKHAERSSAVQYIQGDLHDEEGMAVLGSFDVVWCAGILYHSPNPCLQLENLRRLTARTLVLGTHVVPEVPGMEQACLFYPELSADARQVFARAHGDRASHLLGAGTPFDYAPAMGYANFWWAITPSALRAMLGVAGFEVEEEYRYGPFFMDVVARTLDRPSTVPPLDFSRRRDRARRAEAAAAGRPAWLQLDLPPA